MIRSSVKENFTELLWGGHSVLQVHCVYSLNTSIQNSSAVKFLFLSTRCLSAKASFLDCSKLGIHIFWREIQPGFEDENQNASGLGQLRWLTWASHLWGSHPWQWRQIKGVIQRPRQTEKCYTISNLWNHVSYTFLSIAGSTHVSVEGLP